MPMGRLDLVRQKSEQWAREIIDFGPANTLLHYKDTRTQTIDLTDAEPDAMANLLAGRRTLLSALESTAQLLSSAEIRSPRVVRRHSWKARDAAANAASTSAAVDSGAEV